MPANSSTLGVSQRKNYRAPRSRSCGSSFVGCNVVADSAHPTPRNVPAQDTSLTMASSEFRHYLVLRPSTRRIDRFRCVFEPESDLFGDANADSRDHFADCRLNLISVQTRHVTSTQGRRYTPVESPSTIRRMRCLFPVAGPAPGRTSAQPVTSPLGQYHRWRRKPAGRPCIEPWRFVTDYGNRPASNSSIQIPCGSQSRMHIAGVKLFI